MTSLFPWSGLSAAVGRLDLWAVINMLGGPLLAAGAEECAWLGAGLPFDLLPYLRQSRVDCGGTQLGASSGLWPSRLAGQPFGPVLFGVEGNVALLDRPAVAIVGARSCTPYGMEHAGSIAQAVAGAGGVVVSGLARGIDREAHLGANGATIAVLGQGLDAPMPTWQAALRRRILDQGGLIVSEFPRAMPADCWTFPIRNRIVAGLAVATVVVEASHKSGARNTAGHALRLGREVLAVPGPLNAIASAGCLDLIEEGAIMVRSAATVLAAAGLTAPKVNPAGNDRESIVLAALGTGATPEQIVRATRLAHPEVSAALTVLGLTARVWRLPGNRFVPRPP
jgi:DNA processing protein